MSDQPYIYSNRSSNYYCIDVPALGICPSCREFGPDGRTCWACGEEDDIGPPPTFIAKANDGDGSISTTDMDGLLQLLDGEFDEEYK